MSKTFLTQDQIEDLLDYIGVEKVGQWKGDKINFCCPIHHEKNPSCGINADYVPDDEPFTHYQVFHCFSCSASGSLAWFLYKSLPDDFKSVYEAEQFMADRYGLDYSHTLSDLRKRSLKRIGNEPVKKDTNLKKVLSMAKIAPFKSGKATFKYFFKRGFDKQDMKEWKIGRDLDSRTVTIPAFWEDGSLAGVIGRYIDPDRPKNSRYKIYNFEKKCVLLIMWN